MFVRFHCFLHAVRDQGTRRPAMATPIADSSVLSSTGFPVKESQINVYLVNEDSLPYWYETNSVNNYNLKLTPRKIKLNTPKNARNQKNPYETQSYYPKLNSNWYTCKIQRNRY